MNRLFAIFVAVLFSGAAFAADLQITDIAVGDGAAAVPGKFVTVLYEGKLESGKVFDATEEDSPFRFKLGQGQVIKGWDIGVEGMKVGGERKLVIPSDLAYGERGAGDDIPPGATLVFTIKLLDVGDTAWTDVAISEIEDLVADGAVLIDIRRADEWAGTGIIDGARTVTAFDQSGSFDQRFPMLFQMLGKPNQKFVFICRTGNRSQVLSEFLATRAGYTNIYNVIGGISAWAADGRRLVSPEGGKCMSGC